MYYVAALTPDNRTVYAAGGSLPLALSRFRDAWNEHVVNYKPLRMEAIEMSTDFDVVQFQAKFNRAEHHTVITTLKTVMDVFTDIAADPDVT